MPAMITQRPAPDEYAPYYAGYVAAVPDGDLLALLAAEETMSALSGLSDDRARHRYEAGKWSVKEVVGHVADTERVMAYRALRIGRGDQTPLPGFDQDAFVRGLVWDEIPLPALLDDLHLVRMATLSLLAGFPDDVLGRRGTASGAAVSVRGLCFIIAGHERHHLRILRERYLGAR